MSCTFSVHVGWRKHNFPRVRCTFLVSGGLFASSQTRGTAWAGEEDFKRLNGTNLCKHMGHICPNVLITFPLPHFMSHTIENGNSKCFEVEHMVFRDTCYLRRCVKRCTSHLTTTHISQVFVVFIFQWNKWIKSCFHYVLLCHFLLYVYDVLTCDDKFA